MSFFQKTSLLLALAFIFNGCSSTPRHRAQHEILAGNVYPVEVFVPLEKNESATGKVYYRLKESEAFQQADLTKEGRGERLFTDLPTREMKAGERLEYHITVMKGDKPFYLKSRSDPYRVYSLSKEDLLAKNLTANATCSHAGEPITFTFNSGLYPARNVKVIYQIPSLAGTMSVDMNHYSSGTWRLVVPGSVVHPGIWMYRIEAVIDNLTYQIPQAGFYSIQIHPKTSSQ